MSPTPETPEAPFRAGTVAVLGRPNVGKSTLVNALVGAKVSIVSPRPQTTRHRLLGIATFEAGQLLLVDTPGIHREQKRAMNRMMNRAARGAVEGVDATGSASTFSTNSPAGRPRTRPKPAGRSSPRWCGAT